MNRNMNTIVLNKIDQSFRIIVFILTFNVAILNFISTNADINNNTKKNLTLSAGSINLFIMMFQFSSEILKNYIQKLINEFEYKNTISHTTFKLNDLIPFKHIIT